MNKNYLAIFVILVLFLVAVVSVDICSAADIDPNNQKSTTTFEETPLDITHAAVHSKNNIYYESVDIIETDYGSKTSEHGLGVNAETQSELFNTTAKASVNASSTRIQNDDLHRIKHVKHITIRNPQEDVQIRHREIELKEKEMEYQLEKEKFKLEKEKLKNERKKIEIEWMKIGSNNLKQKRLLEEIQNPEKVVCIGIAKAAIRQDYPTMNTMTNIAIPLLEEIKRKNSSQVVGCEEDSFR